MGRISDRVMAKLGKRFIKKLKDPRWDQVTQAFEKEDIPFGYKWRLRITLIPPAEMGKIGGKAMHKFLGRSMAGWMMGGIAITYRMKEIPKNLKKFLKVQGLSPGDKREIKQNPISMRYVKGDNLIHYIDIYTKTHEWADAQKKSLDDTWEEVTKGDAQALLRSNPFAFGYRAFFHGGGVLLGEVSEI